MPPAASPLLVPYREVRHDQPDDCLHYDPVQLRNEQLDWRIPAHQHLGLHQFQLLTRGSLAGEIDGAPMQLHAPALLMVAPGAVHGWTYSRDALGHQVTVPSATLAALLGDAVSAQAGLEQSFVVDGERAGGVAPQLVPVFEAIAREFTGSDAGRVPCLLAHATVLAVAFLRMREDTAGAHRARGVRDTLVQRYRALVDRHYREHQPLAFYAESLGVTPDHLSRTCRQVAGQSALELLHERVMLEARRLLTYTEAPVAHVAHQLGYGDAAYFSKFFARCVGRSPSAYRDGVARGVQAGIGR